MPAFCSGWRQAPKALTLADGTIHLWRFRLDLSAAESDYLQQDLSPDEIARAERLLIPEKQQQFVVARSGLRNILGRYLCMEPASIQFSYGEQGKPALQTGPASLNFNLAHSGQLALLAVTRTGQIGVDIEYIDQSLDFHLLAEKYFSPQELAVLTSMPEQRQRRTFYRLWTQKESRLKYSGRGFSGRAESGELQTALVCRLLPVAKNYLAAVACSPGNSVSDRYHLTSHIPFPSPQPAGR